MLQKLIAKMKKLFTSEKECDNVIKVKTIPALRIMANPRRGWMVLYDDPHAYPEGSIYLTDYIDSEEKPCGYPENTGYYQVLFGTTMGYLENPDELDKESLIKWFNTYRPKNKPFQLQYWDGEWKVIDLRAFKDGQFIKTNKPVAISPRTGS